MNCPNICFWTTACHFCHIPLILPVEPLPVSELSYACMCAKSRQSCPTLWTVCSLAGSSVHGILQARVLEWGAIAFSNR